MATLSMALSGRASTGRSTSAEGSSCRGMPLAAGRVPCARGAASRGVVVARASSNPSSNRRDILLSATTVAAMVAMPTPAANAIYNEGAPIADGAEALAAVIASQVALQSLVAEIAETSTSCPAPTFPCDLSVLSKKATKRLSGPMKRSLPTLAKEFGCDPYACEDVLQSISTAEAILYSNNARVKVDWQGPQDFLLVANGTLINEVLVDVPPDDLAAARKAVDSCDLSVPPEADGTLECRLVRAVNAGTTPR